MASNMVPMKAESSPGLYESELESVRQELAKWQERVPKLAAALKERTDEVERLKQAGTSTGVADSYSDAGVKARDELIAELEAKVKDLTAGQRDLKGELHSRELVAKDLEAELASWKDKWHSVTQSLDTQSEQVAARKRELEELRESRDRVVAEAEAARDEAVGRLQADYDELKARNVKLNETTELANSQIESLGDNLNNLREQLRAKDARVEELSSSEQQSSAEIEALRTRADDFEARAVRAEQELENDKARLAGLEAEVAEKAEAVARLHKDNEQFDRDTQELLAQMHKLKEEHQAALARQAAEFGKVREAEMQAALARRDESIQESRAQLEAEFEQRSKSWQAQLAEREREFQSRLDEAERSAKSAEQKQVEIERLRGEVERLEGVVQHAEDAMTLRENERRQLSEAMNDADARVAQMEAQLKERSDFAVAMEQEKQHLAAMLEGAKNEHKVVLEAKQKAERHAGEHTQHIAQLNDRLERQKELMQQLEIELADSQEEREREGKESRAQLAAKETDLGGVREDLAIAHQRLEEQDVEFERRMAAMQQSVDKARQKSKNKDKNKEKETGSQPDHSVELEALHTQVADYIAELNQSEARVKELEALIGNEDALDQQRLINQLETTIRERTEELNQLRWREEMAAQEGKAPDGGAKMMVVLNQQLAEARTDNERLVKKLKAFESGEITMVADDLTMMKGIGPKLAQQLRELGYATFASIAQLDPEAIEDEEHPLYPHRTRVQRDAWIDQATKLSG